MESTLLLPLLLLVCSSCGAQVQTDTVSEIVPSREKTEPVHASAHQGPCPHDLHAVLREMSASLAEQKVEMKHLLRESKAQAAKLTELERKTSEVDMLRQKLRVQESELTVMKAASSTTESHVAVLKRDREVKQVAFSASLVVSGEERVGPLSVDTTLIYKHVATNIGNAYNRQTGLFIAPVSGVYHFELHVGAHGYISGATLIKNGEITFTAYEQQASYFGTSSNSISLLLEVRDVVFVRMLANTKMYDNQNHHSTFSGHLLFTV